jgi:hypothetical protein
MINTKEQFLEVFNYLTTKYNVEIVDKDSIEHPCRTRADYARDDVNGRYDYKEFNIFVAIPHFTHWLTTICKQVSKITELEVTYNEQKDNFDLIMYSDSYNYNLD